VVVAGAQPAELAAEAQPAVAAVVGPVDGPEAVAVAGASPASVRAAVK
jgi:hypothetical protein